MSTIGERLREVRHQRGLNQSDFGQLAGVAKRTQILYENNERSPKADYLKALYDMGVDTHYLLTGVRLGTSGGSSLGVESAQDVASIPMYDVECAAGSGRSFEGEPVLGYFHMDRTVLSELKLPADSGAWVRARGDSMVGTIDDGDYVFVDFTQRDPSREGVYLILMDGERRIKRMQRVAGGGWLLISDNPRYDKELIAPEQKQFVEILGRCLVNLGQVL